MSIVMKANSNSSKTALYIILSILGVVIVALAAAVVWMTLSKSSPEKKIENYIKLGQEYLDDNDYESAILEFEKVLDLDSENVDAYIGLYEAYEGLEEYEKALEICQDGYDETDSKKLKKKITYFEELLASADKGNGEANTENSDFADTTTTAASSATTDTMADTTSDTTADTLTEASTDNAYKSDTNSNNSLYERFFNGELGARYYEFGNYDKYLDDRMYYDTNSYDGIDTPEIQWFDLDNDGEDEPYWEDIYDGCGITAIDARDGDLYVIAQGAGTSMRSSYTVYNNETYLVTSDTSHVGRQIYELRKLNGNGNIVDEFDLGAEYWNEPDDKYNENSDFYYRGETITMEEYEALRQSYFGY